MNDFLKAKSMATPGVVGALVTVLTTTLATSFGAPPKWTALGLSFLCGLLVFSDRSLRPLPRIGFYILNSLIIFSTAVGTNGLGVAAAASEPSAAAQPVSTPLPEVTVPHVGAVGTATPGPPSAVPHPAKAEGFFRPWFNDQPAAQKNRVLIPTPAP